MTLSILGIVNKIKNKRTLSATTIIAGCLLVICWTLFRFYTKSVNFDLTGQQLLARQWLDGSFVGSIIGPTNYIIKMIFLYMPAEIIGVNAKVFLISSAIIVNVATFIGIYFLSKKILEYFSIPISVVFNLSMLWLSTIVGSVFWIQYTNSRNIEVVAGLAIIYLGLLTYKIFNLKKAVGLTILSGITFFADPMQLYITAVVLLLYVLVDSLFFNKVRRRNTVRIFVLIVAGYIISILLKMLVTHVTGAEFIGTGSLSQSLAIFSQSELIIVETVKNILRLVAGTNEMGVWRQALNIGFVMFMTLVFIKLVVEKKLSKSFVLFVTILILVPICVYAASGQPIFQTDTSRYLIMIIPAMIICFSSLELQKGLLKRAIILIILAVLLLNITSLLCITVKSQRSDLVGEHILRDRYEYLSANNYSYGYSSMDTAIPSMYLFGKHGSTLLPLSCENKRLRKATLFYDRSVFLKNESVSVENEPIILDGNAISNFPNICTVDDIVAQIGRPLSLSKTVNGDMVLIYGSVVLKNISF